MKRLALRAAILASTAVLPCFAIAAPVAIARHNVVDLGAAPDDLQVKLAITLNYRDEAGLNALVDAIATPGSPQFHQYLTQEEFNARFAPTQADHDRVVAALQHAGFSITRTYENRTVIDASGSAAAVAAYFGTPIHIVAQSGHGTRYANTTAPRIPAEISDAVQTVLGLDNLVKFHVNAEHVDVPAGTSDDVATAGLPVERTVNGAFAGIYPGGTADAYKYPLLKGNTGTGHGIAIVIDADIANSDLSAFWKAAGIKRTGTVNRVLVNGSNPGINGDSAETAIDVETTSSLAAGSNIYIYLASSLNDTDIEDAYNLAITKKNVDVVSSSFGGCELQDTPFGTATDKIALQGAAVGVTYTASTGDSGGDCNDGTTLNPDIVSIPAADPHFVAVGGTTLTINAKTGARVSEVVWGPGGTSGGGGGGVSSLFPKPTYQNKVTGIKVVPTIKASLQPKSGFAGRNLPDISLNASRSLVTWVGWPSANKGSPSSNGPMESVVGSKHSDSSSASGRSLASI